jgi:hypothetical protein
VLYGTSPRLAFAFGLQLRFAYFKIDVRAAPAAFLPLFLPAACIGPLLVAPPVGRASLRSGGLYFFGTFFEHGFGTFGLLFFGIFGVWCRIQLG